MSFIVSNVFLLGCEATLLLCYFTNLLSFRGVCSERANQITVNYSKFIEHLKNTRRMFRWTLDKEGALRARLMPVESSLSSSGSAKPTPPTLLTPVTAVCYMLTNKYYPSIQYAYAASEIDLDLATSRSIERASDDMSSSTIAEQLMLCVNPIKIP